MYSPQPRDINNLLNFFCLSNSLTQYINLFNHTINSCIFVSSILLFLILYYTYRPIQFANPVYNLVNLMLTVRQLTVRQLTVRQLTV